MLRIIIKYSSFKVFWLLETRWDYLSKFGCERIQIHLLTFCFFYHLFKCAPTPNDFVTNPKPTKLNMKPLYPNIIKAFIIHKISCNFFKMWQCDWKHSNTIVTTNLFSLFWKFAQMWKINMRKEHLIIYIFWEKIISSPKDWKLCCDISLLILAW